MDSPGGPQPKEYCPDKTPNKQIMKKYIALVACLLCVGTTYAQFNVDFQRQYRAAQSERTFNADNFAEARTEFLALAADSGTPEEAAKWQARAAIALGSQEGKYEEGLAEAKAIAEHPYSVYAQITLMAGNNEHARIVETFGNETIFDWETNYTVPSGRRLSQEDLRTYTWVDRAAAFAALNDGKRAEKDLVNAAALIRDATFKVNTLDELVTVRQNLLNNPEGAFDANMEIVAVGGGGATFYRGALAAAAWLRDKEQYDKALEVIRGIEESQGQPFELGRGATWPANLLRSYALTYEAMGDKDKAIETYRRILLINGLSDRLQAQTEERIQELSQ